MDSTESRKTVRDLQKVLEISRSMEAATDLDSLLGLIIDRSMELLEAERASLFLYDPKTDELVSRIAAGVQEIRVPADRGFIGSAIKTGKTINVPDAYADPRFNPQVDRATGFRTRNVLSVPLRDYQGQLVGVLQVLNKRSGSFGEYDVTLAETLGAQAGVALQRARLIEHYLQKQQMERAMKIAQDIQQGLLPQRAPFCCGFDIAGISKPADETGGDTFDFLQLPDGRWMLMVADATGHGIGPALVIAETRAMLRAVSLHGPDIPLVLETVNNLLVADLGDARFVTCFFGLMDPLRCRMAYASAGHGPLLFYDRQADAFRELAATSLPLGIMEQTEYKEVGSFDFAPGDFAVITTDGVFEATNAADEQFGIARMTQVLRRCRDLTAAGMIDALRVAVLEFAAGEPQADDITAVIVRRK